MAMSRSVHAPRRGSPPGRGRSVRGLAVGAAAAAAFAILPTTAGSAAPLPTPTEVAAKVRSLQQRVDHLVEAYDTATVRRDAATERAAAIDRLLRDQQAKTDGLRANLGRLASAAYQSNGNGSLIGLLGSQDPQQFLDSASSLNMIAHERQFAIASFQEAQRQLDEINLAAAAELAERQRIQTAIQLRRREIERSLLQQEQLLGRLAPGLRVGLVGSAGLRVPLSSIDATGRAATAIHFAYAQLGKPYSWGAAGPDAYDCSGLTMAAWGVAGLSLPHSSAAQFGSGPQVATQDLRPGDLVFYGSPIHHVGLYIGAGNMIVAPHTGDVVKIQPALRPDLVGAVRPG